jgi:hypothetical protein
VYGLFIADIALQDRHRRWYGARGLAAIEQNQVNPSFHRQLNAS